MSQITASLLNFLVNGQDFKTVKKLSLDNQNLNEVNSLLNDFENLEELDISNNSIKDLTPLELPSLKILKCRNNEISFFSIQGVKNLDEIEVFGNPIPTSDHFFLVDQVPDLKLIDGASTVHIKNILHHINLRFAPILEAIFVKEFDVADLTNFTKELFQKFDNILNKYPMPEISQKFREFKMLNMTREFIRKKQEEIIAGIVPEENQTDSQVTFVPQLSDANNPSNTEETSSISSSIISLPLSGNTISSELATKLYHPRAERTENETTANRSPPRRQSTSRANEASWSSADGSEHSPRCKKQKTSNGNAFPIEFSSEKIIFPHSQVAPSQVWKAAFEPIIGNKGRIGEIVATCGSNIVCFINCSTNMLLKRFNLRDTKEDLFALAWTVLPIANSSKVSTFLAIAGKSKKINLMHPSSSGICLGFEAHTGEISSLLFSEENPSHLFSGADDGIIYLWDIGTPELPDYQSKHEKLLSFDAGLEVLHLALSPSPFNLLIAAGEGGLLGWQLPPTFTPSLREANFQFEIPGRSKFALFDGLVFTSDKIVATKEAQSSTIQLWDLEKSLGSNCEKWFKRKKAQIKCKVIENLEYDKECKTDYLSLNYHPERQILMCGDDQGNFWLYNLVNSTSLMLNWPALAFENESPETKHIINHLVMSPSGRYLVACTDKNGIIICKEKGG